MTHRDSPRVLAGVLAVAFVVLGCHDAQDAPSPTIPRVKAYEIGETTRGQARTLSGELVAGTSSPLSFGVSGTVDQVLAARGDTVEEGQVLATLDAEPLRLALEQARAELAGSRAKLVETQQAYERGAKLLEQRGISQADYEVATSQVRSARASLRSVQSKVEQQERDLRRAELRAPFAGRIADRSVDAFQEVAASDEAFVLQGDGQLKVKLQVPDTLIRNVAHGTTVRVRFPTLEGVELVGVVSLIGTSAETGSAFPVEVQLPTSTEDLRPGMSASVTFNFDEYLEGKTAFLMPLSAVAIDVGLLRPEAEDGEVPVFVFDEASGRVHLRRVRVLELRDNQLEVYEGLEPGEKVISAGVPFLRDGMEVEIWSPELGLTDG